jgi:hypothetical protein
MAATGKKAFLLRVDPSLWAELERLAAAEVRSVNGQIEYLLRMALNERKDSAAKPEASMPQTDTVKRPADNA